MLKGGIVGNGMWRRVVVGREVGGRVGRVGGEGGGKGIEGEGGLLWFFRVGDEGWVGGERGGGADFGFV